MSEGVAGGTELQKRLPRPWRFKMVSTALQHSLAVPLAKLPISVATLMEAI